MVSSNEVLALTPGPSRIPIDSMKVIRSCLAKCLLPLNAMCSSTWATPRWSSSSTTEPTFTTRRSSARCTGRSLVRM